MDAIVSAITGWKDLISKVFGEYPLAAALLTLLAIGLYFYLQKEKRRNKAATNILIVLFAWAIAVPILGFALTVLGKIWEFVEAVAPAIAKAVGSFYSIYDRHPFLVITLLVIAIIAYFVWKKWWPKVLPSRGLRIVALTIAVVVTAHIANPIANVFVTAEPALDKKAISNPTAPQPSSNVAPAVTSPTSSPAATVPPAAAPPTSGGATSATSKAP